MQWKLIKEEFPPIRQVILTFCGSEKWIDQLKGTGTSSREHEARRRPSIVLLERRR